MSIKNCYALPCPPPWGRLVVGSLLLTAPAFAQTTAPATATSSEEATVNLPEFRITETAANPYLSKQALSASRVAMDVQDIPQTISIVTSDFIKDTMSNRMIDAVKYVTPVSDGSLPANDRYMSRGFQTSHEFIDGVELSGADGYSLAIAPYNIERIEVIKGPNAILVPGGAPGGQFNPITKSPILKDQGSVTLSLAEYMGNDVSVDVNRIVSAKNGFAIRLVAAFWKNEGYSKNSFRDGYMFAPSASWQLSPAHKLTIKAEIMQSKESNGVFLPIDPSVGSDDYAIVAKGLPRDFSFGNDEDFRRRASERITFELLSTLGSHVSSRLVLVGNSVVRDDQGATNASLVGVANPPSARNPLTGKYEPGTTYTVNNTGTNATFTSSPNPLPDPSTYVFSRSNPRLHLFFSEAHLRNDYAIKFEDRLWKSTTITGLAANSSRMKFKGSPTAFRSNVAGNNLAAMSYEFWPYLEPAVGLGASENRTTQQSDLQGFVYENLSFLQDRLIVSGGLSRFYGTLSRIDSTGIGSIGPSTFHLSTSAKSYGIVVKPIKPVSLFYSYNSSGKTLPGSTAGNNTTSFPPFQPQDGYQDEYGVKTTWLDGKLTASFAYYEITQTNYSVPNSDRLIAIALGVPGAASLPSNLYLDINSEGWEFEGSYAVNKNFTIIGNYADGEARQPTGVRIRSVPDTTWAVFGDYRFVAGALKGFGVSVGVDGKTDTVGENASGYTTARPLVNAPPIDGVAPGLVPNQPTYKNSGRTLVNVSFNYRAETWSAQVQVANATDREYFTGGINRSAMMVAEPRSVRGSVTYKF